jgi:choline-sulfatase
MKRVPLIFLTAAGLLAAAASTRCGSGQLPPPPSRSNVLLITIDTLRADRLRRGFTPALDALADSGIRVDNTRTTVPLTLPAHVTIMTGALPPVHGVRENGVVFTPRPTAVPLARRFRDAGYQTGAFVGAYVLDRRFGLAEGFDVYDDRIKYDGARLEAERSGREVVDAALGWLARARTPFFLWVHLYDPHAPYEPPAEFLAKAAGNPYDGEVAYADAQVSRLIEALKARGLASSTIIAATGDHGEGLGDHGEQTHGMLAYDSTLRVPLILAGPGSSPRVVTSPVSLTNLARMLLARSGVMGPNQATIVDDEVAKNVETYAETRYPRSAGWHALVTLADDRWKLILSNEAELYDLSTDAAERTNVAANHEAIVAAMRLRLANVESSGTGDAPAASPEASERLRALGYVSGSPVRGSGSPTSANPARVIDSWNAFELALSQVNAGRAKEALPALERLSSRFPAAAVFQTTYGRALKDSGQAAKAVAVYRNAVAHIHDAGLFHDLAVAAREAGNVAEALKAEQAALALEGNNPAALNGLGLLHIEAGRAKDAAASFERAASLDPSNPSYWTNLGNARRELGDQRLAEAAYKRALESDSTYPDAANGLGTLLVQAGKATDAIPWFELALKRSPEFHEARLNLGIAFQEAGQRERAAATYREILAKAPKQFARERKAAAELLGQLK